MKIANDKSDETVIIILFISIIFLIGFLFIIANYRDKFENNYNECVIKLETIKECCECRKKK